MLWDRSINKYRHQLDTQLFFACTPDFYRGEDYHFLPRFPSQWTPPSSPYSDALKCYIEKVRQSGRSAIRRKPTKPSQIYLYIYTRLRRLKDNVNIVVKPADKNLGLVILNRSTYRSMCLEHLNDKTTYTLINNPQQEYSIAWSSLQSILIQENRYYKDHHQEKLSYLAHSLCQLRYSSKLRPAQFYCLPKIHKNATPIPGRPIASAPSTITYYTSIYINNILKVLLPYLPTICQSSSEALRTVVAHTFPTSSMIFTADVKSLYPSIPTTLGLDCVKTILEISKCFSSSKINFIIKLMRWVLTNNFISFEDSIYLQIEGTAMGTPMAPTYAILFMYAIERHHLQNALFYVRYIDDIFAIFNSIVHMDEFVNAINSVIPNRLKLESIVYGQDGIFLDIQFKLSDGILTYQLYQKPHNTFAYIPTSSDHPASMFKSFVLEEIKRYYRNCSDFETFLTIAESFKIRLQHRGYQPSIFHSAYQTFLTKHIPINLPSSRISLQSNYPPLKLAHASPPEIRKIQQPIMVINMPVINHSVNWRSFIHIPDFLRDTLAFQLAFKSSDVIICKCSPRTLGMLYISSKF